MVVQTNKMLEDRIYGILDKFSGHHINRSQAKIELMQLLNKEIESAAKSYKNLRDV